MNQSRTLLREPPAHVSGALVVLVASVALGAATSVAQGILPDEVASFANSASGWTLLTALLLWWARPRWRWAALLGALSFVLLVLGYTWMSQWRGLHYDPLRWSVVGVVTGPVIGVAAVWIRGRGIRAALATAVLAGVGVGEGIYGLAAVRETTSPVYWGLALATGGVLVAVMVAQRLRELPPKVVAMLGAAAVAAVFQVAFRMI